MWWIRFQAFATVKNFSEALVSNTNLPASKAKADLLDPTDSSNKEARKATLRNNIAMAQLTIAFETQALLSLADSAKSTDWPGGLAYKVISSLKEKYQPNDRIAVVELERKLNQVDLKEYEDPKILFERIATIENKYRNTSS